MQHDVLLITDGEVYGGWQEIRVTRSIEQTAGFFELAVSERWPDHDTPRRIVPGTQCHVTIAGDLVITGYVDTVKPEYDRQEHRVTVVGRDATADLIDCSAVHKSGQWANRTITQIAADLLRPFGIPLKADVDVGAPFVTFAINPGETVFDALERMARQRALLLVSDGMGGLRITRRSGQRIRTPLRRGGNILAAKGVFSWANRYSRYIAQTQSRGWDTTTPEQNAQPNAAVTDTEITRYRPFTIVNEAQGDAAKLRERAAWERNVRAGRGAQATITVQGWSHGDGLWHPNRLVDVDDAWLGIDGEMLITTVTHLLDGDGSRTEIDVMRPAAFDRIELPDPDETSTWRLLDGAA